jgi:Zn-dependent protease with chaperone function/Zn-finger nucleic acid-binding protein
MNCPRCASPTLVETLTKNGVLVDHCKTCRGVWLDRGEIFLFSQKPRDLEKALSASVTERRTSDRRCPRCELALEAGTFLRQGLEVDQCPSCEGYWFDAGELREAMAADRAAFALEAEDLGDGDPGAMAKLGVALDHAAPDEAVHTRARDLASGMLSLPNLWIRSFGGLFLLYAMLGVILVSLAELNILSTSVAVGIGVGIIVLQFVFGPWLMDLALRWLYKFTWVGVDGLPEHLRDFVTRVAREQGMKTPSFGLIHDGAPNAFTYGHTPRNMRIVITEGILDLLEPAEVEAVVAHEMGHGKNWDMLLMTVAQLVPLLLYFAYRTCLQGRGNNKGGGYGMVVGIGAYVLYIASEYVVLWFSRCREYYADRFAGRVTGDPNAVASALVKIGYGLAARGKRADEEAAESAKGKKKKKKADTTPMLDAIGALGIFDRKSAVAMVASSAGGVGVASGASPIGKENLKSAMQWDLWNPWAMFYELNSTHPLIAKRLQYLGDQAAAQGQDPYILFDRRKPESYWDEFLVDVVVLFLPGLLLVLGIVASIAVGVFSLGGQAINAFNTPHALAILVGLPLLGLGIGSLVKTYLCYRANFFAPLNVSGLLHKVKVSAVRPVPARVKGTVIGRGVPGLIWSEDFVMQDRSGILLLDYRQPLRIWEFFFGLLRGGEFAGKTIEAEGWFRRSPVPYLELKSMTADGKTRRCYARHMKYFTALVLAVGGAALVAWGFLA